MSTISTFGKYLDQPMLVSKISEAAPATLVLAAAAYGLYDTKKQKDEEKQVKTYIKNICVLGFTVAFALIATKK